MSLLNKMLQDLDARQNAGGVAARLPDDVRPLPVVAESRLPRLLAGLLLVVGAVGAAVYFLWPETVDTPPSMSPMVTAPAEVPPALTPPVPEKQPEPVADEPPQLSLPEGSLRLADALFMPADKKPAPKPALETRDRSEELSSWALSFIWMMMVSTSPTCRARESRKRLSPPRT